MLTVIIVNYKTASLVSQCLASLYRHTSSINLEIIVVDNDSADGIAKMLEEKFPAARFVQMGYNSGFARANNEGIRQSLGDTVLLLNSDTIIESNAIAEAYERLAASGMIACGVQLRNTDGSPQISGNYFMKGAVNHLLPLPYMGQFLKFVAGMLKVKKPNVPEAKGTIIVDWINGAFLMVKKTAIERSGLLDEDFFLYAEEAEWCYRLGKAGQMCIYGDLHVVHLQGESANEAFGSGTKGYANLFDRKGLQIMLSNGLRIRKQYGAGWFLFYLLIHILDVPLFFFGILFSSLLFWRKPAHTFRQWYGFSKNVIRLIQYTPLVISGKPHFYKVL